MLQFSAFNGMVSFMPKYLEQQFGKSASDAIFLIGMFPFCFDVFFKVVMSLCKLYLYIYTHVYMYTYIYTKVKCFYKWGIPH